MADMGLFEAAHIGAEFRLPQPERHLPLEHAALAPVVAGTRPLAGDHEHEPGAVGLRLTQESEQRDMRLALSAAVQIEARVDLDGTARQTLLEAPIEKLERRRGLR